MISFLSPGSMTRRTLRQGRCRERPAYGRTRECRLSSIVLNLSVGGQIPTTAQRPEGLQLAKAGDAGFAQLVELR